MTSCGESTVPRSSGGREAMAAAFRVPGFRDVQRRHERLHDLIVGLEALRVAFCLRQHRRGRLSKISSKTYW